MTLSDWITSAVSRPIGPFPAEEETAVNGQWVKAPGLKLFRALEAALGPLPLVAEDLGVITAEVDALRLEMRMPGMKVIQFGFSSKGAHTHLPHHYTPETVAYTGTHDNDTTQGWWKTASQFERNAAEAYVGPIGDHPVWPLLRATAGSVAQLALAPAQDLLELGLRGPHEYAVGSRRELELARTRRKLEAGIGGWVGGGG